MSWKMVCFFHFDFLRSHAGITEEERRFLDTVEVVFEGENIGEFDVIAGKENRE